MEPTTTKFKDWWNAKSKTFSRFGGGDTYTHGEVVITHLVLLALTIAVGLVGGSTL